MTAAQQTHGLGMGIAEEELTALFEEFWPRNPYKYGRMNGYKKNAKGEPLTDPKTGKKQKVIWTSQAGSPAAELDILTHLREKATDRSMGYLAGSKEGTSTGAWDFDSQDYGHDTAQLWEAVVRLRDVLDKYGIPSYSQTSVSGNGEHLWVFFDAELTWEEMSDFLKTVAEEAGCAGTETYPHNGNSRGKWISLPYPGVLVAGKGGLGHTYLQDGNSKPIPLSSLREQVERASTSIARQILASTAERKEAEKAARTHKEAQPAQAGEDGAALDPSAFPALRKAVLSPPDTAVGHGSAMGLLNVAERMGKRDEMLELLLSAEVAEAWAHGRTPEEWEAELARMPRVSDKGKAYGIASLKKRQWDLPELPPLGQQSKPAFTPNLSWEEKFAALAKKYAPGYKIQEGTDELTFRRRKAYKDRPKPQRLVPGLLSRGGLCGLVGPSGGGKSLLALDVGMHVATGKDWHGRKVVQGNVAYFAAEAETETWHRYDAWCDHAGLDPDDVPLYFAEPDPTLSLSDVNPGGGLEKFIKGLKSMEREVGPLELVIVDTVANTFDGDENNNDDIKRYENCVGLAARALNCTVWLLHHTGKDVSRGARGASAFRSQLEMEIILEKDRGAIKLSQGKHRGSADGQELPRLFFQNYAWTEDGELNESAILCAAPDSLQIIMLSEQEKAVYQALVDLSEEAKVQSPQIPRKAWLALCDARKIPLSTVKDSIRELIKNKHVIDLGPKDGPTKGPYMLPSGEED